MQKRFIFLLGIFIFLTVLAGCSADIPEETEPEPVMPVILGTQIADGSYEIDVEASSSMFRVVKCVLTAANGEMQAEMTMSGQGYGMVYMGTGEKALLDSEEKYIPFVLDENGGKVFTVPVEGLNMELDCAAWSIRKEKWYDRTLIFHSERIPAESLSME
ncbi:MAG: hypothetical protein IJ325_11375 [Clostridia bacterium]|nr:hypothetical protein [Clostridia bacterium]